MLSVNRYALNSSSFEFKFTTSDGDKIDLKLSDTVEASSSFKKGDGEILEEFTLKHKFGYEFSYEGNGLSSEDIKEIKEAFKKMQPLLEKFLKEKKENDKVMSNVSNYLKGMLPKIKNDNHLNAMKSEGVKTFDDVLKKIKAGLDELNKAKELFDKLFSNKLEIFA
jgi:hypothetical protein